MIQKAPIQKIELENDGWGAIPTLGGDPATALPPAPGEASAATEAQNTTAVVQSNIQAAALPPPPPISACLGRDGQFSPVFYTWLQQLWRRSGYSFTTSATDMDVLTEFDDVPQTVRFPDPVDVMDPMPQIAALRDKLDELALQDIPPHTHPKDSSKANFSSGTWAPVATNLGGTGIAYPVARYTRLGDVVFFTIKITGTALTMTANVTGITLPFTPVVSTVCYASSDANNVSLGTGICYTDGKVYPPSATSNTSLVISGMFFV